MTNSTITLHYHPYSRAASVVWMLEEVAQPYSLKFIDLRQGEQRSAEQRKLNPMGKIPILLDGSVVISESAAIGLYLADRYAGGRLAPPLDAPERGAYLRWSCFAPAVIEPCCMAKLKGWDVNTGQAGWGDYDSVLEAIAAAITPGPWILGQTFSMADVIFGGTIDYMLRFKLIEARPSFTDYATRLATRPAYRVAQEKNAAMRHEHGLGD